MRLGELVLLSVTLLGALRPLTAWRRSTGVAIAAVSGTLLAAIVHSVAEGPRWQMGPVYLAALGTAALAAGEARRPGERGPRRSPTVVALVLLMTGAALAWALPAVELPEPRGPHPVGTTELVVTDEDREERYGDRPGDPRRLAVQVWYPAAPDSEGERAPWSSHPGAFARNAAEHFGLPAFALSHLGLVRSHAVADAPAASGASRPLVIYSHGWSAFRTAQSSLLESLASRGFVVMAIDHTHASLASVFPDGEVVAIDPAALPEDAEGEAYATAAERLTDTFADDIETLVDHLRSQGPLHDIYDLANIGLLGHSAGGGAAILACGRLRGCNAVVGFDPWVEPLPDETVGAGLDRPLLSLRSEEWTRVPNDRRLRRLHAASGDAHARVRIHGAGHRDFTLAPLLSPLATRPFDDDAIAPSELHALVDEWTVAFLRHHLDGARRDPLTDPPRHPGTTLER